MLGVCGSRTWASQRSGWSGPEGWLPPGQGSGASGCDALDVERLCGDQHDVLNGVTADMHRFLKLRGSVDWLTG